MFAALLWTVGKQPRSDDAKAMMAAAGSDKVPVQPMKSSQDHIRRMTQRGDNAAAGAAAAHAEEGTELEELVLRITRDAGVGLGMSVAGGVGTTPFSDNDQVLCLSSVLSQLTQIHRWSCSFRSF